jgi:hypothetical protein
MVAHRSWLRSLRPRWVVTTGLTVAVAVGLSSGAGRPGGEAAERWTSLVQKGDELAAGPVSATLHGPPLTAAKAYLLAFHEAQDMGDLEHVLAVADRLDTAGEIALAAHVRRAAQTLLEEMAE